MHATEHRQSRPNPHSRRFTFQLRVVAVAAPKPPAMAETADKVAMYGSAADGKGNTACREGGWTEEQGKLGKLAKLRLGPGGSDVAPCWPPAPGFLVA